MDEGIKEIANQSTTDGALSVRNITLKGEAGSKVFVNGKDTKLFVNSTGEVQVPLNTSGLDGEKLYKISLVDGAGNVGEAISVTIAKDTTPPKEVKVSLPSFITSADMMEATITGENGNKLFDFRH